MSESRHDISQFPQQLRTENIVKTVTWTDEGNGPFGALLESSMRPATAIFLDQRLTDSHIQVFFDNAISVLLQMQPQELRRAYEGLINEQKLHDNLVPSGIPANSRFKVYLGIAIGSLYMNQARRTAAYAEKMFDAAMSTFEDIVKTCSTVAVVDCMLYLIVYSTLTMPAQSTWHLISLAMRLAVSAGSHKSLDAEHGISQSDISHSRNLFWSLYHLDR